MAQSEDKGMSVLSQRTKEKEMCLSEIFFSLFQTKHQPMPLPHSLFWAKVRVVAKESSHP